MKKALIAVGAIAGIALLARRFAGKCGGIDFEQMIERMPDNAPPKWMFTNISAIRANTERILELVEAERTPDTHEQMHAAV
jgi:hypothetical protein